MAIQPFSSVPVARLLYAGRESDKGRSYKSHSATAAFTTC